MSDILDLIDDAVEQRCACGCGAHLDERGESMWFASAQCQRVYHERGATNPYDVYTRRDAAWVRPGHDEAKWTPGGGEWDPHGNPAPLAQETDRQPARASRVQWAPAGTDLRDQSQWRDISGYVTDDGIDLEPVDGAEAGMWQAANPSIGGQRIRMDVVARFMAEAGVDLLPWQRQVVDRVMGIPVHQLDPHRPVFILAASAHEAEEVARIWELPRSRWRQITDGSGRLRGTRRVQVIVTECWREHVPSRAAREIDYLLRDTDAEVIYVPCP